MSAQKTATVTGKGRPPVGRAAVPADKSISHRALIIGCLARGKTTVSNLLDSEDVASTLGALRLLGAEIETAAGKTTVRCEKLTQPAKIINAGNSGTTARLLAGVLSAQPFESAITGDRYLVKRPMRRVITPLSMMGARISSDGGKLPLAIKGAKLRPIRYELPVPSAQVKSAVLLAGLFADGKTTVAEPEQTRDHTEIMLKNFGARVEADGREITVTGGADGLKAADIEVPADISSAIFPIAAAVINPGARVMIENVGVNPSRTGALEILREMGADIRVGNPKNTGGEKTADIEATGGARLKAVRICSGETARLIDELPAIAAVACFAEGVTTITGAEELRAKESDRIRTMTAGLKKLGAQVEELRDGMRITGGGLTAGECDSGGDHRVAMALAVAATGAEGNSTICDCDCVAVSFKGFFRFLERLRAPK